MPQTDYSGSGLCAPPLGLRAHESCSGQTQHFGSEALTFHVPYSLRLGMAPYFLHVLSVIDQKLIVWT